MRLEPSFGLDGPAEVDIFRIAMQRRAESPEAMMALGREAGAMLAPGSVVALVGDLGSGKTHWTKGLVAALGCAAEVTSPTFGLIHEYTGGRCPVFHIDLYRLDRPEQLVALGWDEYLDGGGVVVVEWGDKFPELLPALTNWWRFVIEADGSRTVCRMPA